MSSQRSMSFRDFSVGLLSALAKRDITVIDMSTTALHAAVQAAYHAVEHDASVRFRFHIITDKLHGDSPDIHAMISYALSAGLLRNEADSQRLQLRVPKRHTDVYLETAPGGRELYEKAAQAFLEHSTES